MPTLFGDLPGEQQRLANGGRFDRRLLDSFLGRLMLAREKDVLFCPFIKIAEEESEPRMKSADWQMIKPGETVTLKSRTQVGGRLTVLLTKNSFKSPLGITALIFNTDKNGDAVDSSRRAVPLVELGPETPELFAFIPNAPFLSGETLHLLVKNRSLDLICPWEFAAILLVDEAFSRQDLRQYGSFDGDFCKHCGGAIHYSAQGRPRCLKCFASSEPLEPSEPPELAESSHQQEGEPLE